MIMMKNGHLKQKKVVIQTSLIPSLQKYEYSTNVGLMQKSYKYLFKYHLNNGNAGDTWGR